MTSLPRPVQVVDLLQTPEMSLRHPSETRARLGTGANEGEGTGYDNSFPDAYVERWFQTATSPAEVLDWFDERLLPMGWTGTKQQASVEFFTTYDRQPGESVSITYFGPDPHLALPLWFRFAFQVAGRWPDGSTEPRPQ